MSLTRKIWLSGQPEPPNGVMSDLDTVPPNWFREPPASAAELYGLERYKGDQERTYHISILTEDDQRLEFKVTVKQITDYKVTVKQQDMLDRVHILKHGQSFCGMPNVPAEWPAGHRWVSFEDTENLKNVNCPACLRIHHSV